MARFEDTHRESCDSIIAREAGYALDFAGKLIAELDRLLE